MMITPIHIHGSLDDVHTILRVPKYYFSPDFKEYLLKERLYGWRLDLPDVFFGDPTFGWVFWSQLDNFADLIRQAIQELIGAFEMALDYSLVQFWAATKTSEGRTLLTTQFQPFVLGPTYYLWDRSRLCEYRMGMCREYNNSFYADAECAQELLGLPGRVFLNQLPESAPDVKYYTLKEYPQRDLALRCKIKSSLALPVFEHSGHTCVGVLEIVSLGFKAPFWHDKSFLSKMYDIFQEAGLQCFDGYKHSKLQVSGMNVISEDQNIPRLEAVQNGEVTMQLDSSHQPPLDPLNNGQNVVIAERNIIIVTSSEECKRETQKEHKGTGVKIEVPLKDILKCAKMSRKGAAEKLQVSVSTLKRVCRHYDIQRWPPRNIKKYHSFRSLPVENEGQTRQHLNSDLPSNQASDSVAHTKPAFQDANIVTIRAKYENNTIKFRLSLPSRLVALQQEVTKRLNLEDGTYYIRYEDEENELILIACDQDLQDCIDTFKSLGKASVVVQLEPK